MLFFPIGFFPHLYFSRCLVGLFCISTTMADINSTLQNARTHINNLQQFKQVAVVLGNESCDLDSAISSLVYSLFLDHKKLEGSIVIPVLNIPRIQLPVKIELNYFLRRNNINVDNIVCKDEIDLNDLHQKHLLQLTLVDHHVLESGFQELSDSVVTVVDHRPQAYQWSNADLTIEGVGSCCTLVAEKLLSQAPELVTPTVALLLLGVILIDTNALSSSAGLAKPKDINIANQLESQCGQPIDRKKLFDDLLSAKRDISSLTSAQLLIKDLKVAAGIPIVGLPIKVYTFLQRSDAPNAIKDFCEQYATQLCVLYGMDATTEPLTRDVAVYTPSNPEAASKLVRALKGSEDPNLMLQEIPCSLNGVSLFEQKNVKATRKQILPIVKKFGEKC